MKKIRFHLFCKNHEYFVSTTHQFMDVCRTVSWHFIANFFPKQFLKINTSVNGPF